MTRHQRLTKFIAFGYLVGGIGIGVLIIPEIILRRKWTSELIVDAGIWVSVAVFGVIWGVRLLVSPPRERDNTAVTQRRMDSVPRDKS